MSAFSERATWPFELGRSAYGRFVEAAGIEGAEAVGGLDDEGAIGGCVERNAVVGKIVGPFGRKNPRSDLEVVRKHVAVGQDLELQPVAAFGLELRGEKLIRRVSRLPGQIPIVVETDLKEKLADQRVREIRRAAAGWQARLNEKSLGCSGGA